MASGDRDALKALFRATDGDSWTEKENWATDAELSTWDGVTVDVKGRVTELVLPDNGLQGIVSLRTDASRLRYLVKIMPVNRS